MLVAALMLAGTFWTLRLADPTILRSGTLQPFNPLENVWRFVKQPRLRLAWAIAFGRSVFWSALFIYGPILLLESGLTKQQGGYLISASQLLLPAALVFGWLARRFTVRHVITTAFLGISTATIIAASTGAAQPLVTIVMLLLAALCATALDGVGAVPYMRAVKPRERQQMTSVYRTFLEISDILPGMIFMVLLTLFGTAVVFVVVGSFAAVLAILAWRHLPKSL